MRYGLSTATNSPNQHTRAQVLYSTTRYFSYLSERGILLGHGYLDKNAVSSALKCSFIYVKREFCMLLELRLTNMPIYFRSTRFSGRSTSCAPSDAKHYKPRCLTNKGHRLNLLFRRRQDFVSG